MKITKKLLGYDKSLQSQPNWMYDWHRIFTFSSL